MKALTFSKFGTSDVLEYVEIEKPKISAGEVLVKMEAIGLNYADIYRRKGNYHLKGNPPFIAGYEGAGIVVESNSTMAKAGDRIAFADVPFANAEFVSVPEEHIIPISENISFDLAASVLLQGLTAQYLSEDSFKVKKNDVVLIHAAAGGVGQILTQICKMKGAKVIGLTRDESKLQIIKNNKSDFALQLHSNWTQNVVEITNGKGVDVVFDSVGSTLMQSFEVTKECGTVVFYGMSGGDPALINPRMLMDTSKTLTGGDLWSHINSHQERIKRSKQLFDWITDGKIIIQEPKKFKLSEGKKAHDYLESGKSSSKVLLIP
ncbi:MAG: quinone oxidoreductase [Weeksellaceae bacterium]|nr:quinone oxidoreductase [Bacteroidota bacterium]MCG2780141.1 quinone oxidoreductase [Weeksellaceae bacterium]